MEGWFVCLFRVNASAVYANSNSVLVLRRRCCGHIKGVALKWVGEEDYTDCATVCSSV